MGEQIPECVILMVIQTGRFGQLTIDSDEIIELPQGLIGMPSLTRFCLVDSGDETLILWLQSLDRPEISIPVLEPKIFKPDYIVRLSGAELRELKLVNLTEAAVFTLLTIPEDVSQMSANIKAPIVVNLKTRMARQVVLQENDYSIKHLMFKELRAHLLTIEANKGQSVTVEKSTLASTVVIGSIPGSQSIRSLQLG